MRERLHIGTGGWVEYRTEDADLYLRFQDRDGRLRVFEMVWAPDAPITGDTLRALQLGRIEAAVNRPALAENLRASLDRPGPDLRRALSRDVKQVSSHAVVPRYEVAPVVPVPEGRGKYPDSFYRRVADRYSALQASGERDVARQIADANEVPLTTVHRWVKEARRRGFLPPGRRGKAG
jgi:ABC-type amino acid transport substrate-binding protein